LNDLQRALLKKADRSISAAKILYDQDIDDAAISRAYYAVLYTAKALLLSKNLVYRKHSGVISAFGEHFVKTGLIDRKYHEIFIRAFSMRSIADYDPMAEIPDEDVKCLFEDVADFIEQVRKYLEK
jgi:uncharacterized protein (UPF0332 family)